MIYFDNAATVAQTPEVTKAVTQMAEEHFFNSAAMYPQSLSVKQKIDNARTILLNRLSANGSGSLLFTSGATESNNMIIFGKAAKRGAIVCLAGEHSSVFQPIKFLSENGHNVITVPLKANGLADLRVLETLSCKIDLVVFGLVNSDTGTIQDARAIVSAIRQKDKNAHIHCDATQAFCKTPFDCADMGVDSVSISAHKIGGPKGIGALWLKNGVNLKPMILGAGAQPLRPGTENTPGIIGFAVAAELYDTKKAHTHVSNLHAHLVKNLPPACTVNGLNNNPYITNISVPALGQTVLNALAKDNIIIGVGSACSSGAAVNRTLASMGLNPQKSKQVIRLSFSQTNTISEVDQFLVSLKKALEYLS
ncbi:MAG: aminotransferase class V-fold PLP-dependent enzyme [Firmicutes bacterium]|nr:aminotransferase class V-fold PLP-dependent enzyme [Bacillota bacterium]